MIRFAVVAICAVAAVALVGLASLARAQNVAGRAPAPSGSIRARVDSLFAQWDRRDSPGCSLGVSRNGTPVYERGYGMASLELGVPITPASVFHVASVSKQFTAMSVVLLAGRGRLSLDDEARKYIDGLPDYGSPLTIRHLLSHTGGLRDVFLLRELTSPGGGARPNDELVALLARQRGLNFTPGTDYQYNNGGYLFLAAIVQRVSGQPLAAFAETNIFKPLGMTDTHFHDDPEMVVSSRASGYAQADGRMRVAVRADPGGVVGNTGLFTTARDLLRWEENFASPRVGDPALVASMQEATALAGGGTSNYGLGLQIGEHRGLRTIGHGGNDPGYSADVVRYPDHGLAVAVLCNLENIDAVRLTREVAEIYLAGAFAAPPATGAPAPPAPVALSRGQLAGKAGLYRYAPTESLLRVFVRDGRLKASGGAGEDGGFELTPLGPDRFAVGTTTLEFVPETAGRAQELHIVGDKSKREVFRRVGGVAPSAADLRAFAGEYTSSELEVTYTLAVRDSRLVIRIPGRKDIVLEPVFADAFAGEIVGVVKFERNAGGALAGFTLNTSGVQGLRFARS